MKELFDRVLASPDDDAARLVYADALQGAGDPRGELIAVQCELARLGWDAERVFLEWLGDERVDRAALDDGRFAKLRRREAEIFRDHAKVLWPHKIPKFATDMFRRGFVEHLSIQPAQTVDQLLAMAPLLRSIRTGATQKKAVDAFFGAPKLCQIWELLLDPYVMPWLVEGKNLAGLRDLTLQHGGGPHALPSLTGAPFFANLEVLTLYGFSLDAAAVTTLFGRASRLRELQIVDSRMGAEAAEALMTSPALDDVRVLALRYARLLGGKLGPLFTSPKRWRSLTALDVRTNALAAWDTAAIAELRSLRILDLGNNASLGTPGIEALVNAKARGLGELRSLSLQKAGVDDHGVKALARSALMTRLRVLDLRSNAITDAGARALVRDGAAKGLRVLFLGANQISAAGKKAIKAALPTTRLFA